MLFIPKLLLLSGVIGAGGCTALAQDPVAAFPKNYSLALNNDTVSVIRVHYGPHEHVGVHDHSDFPTIYIYLSDSGPVHFTHDEKPPFELTRPPVTKGAFRVSPGRKERHSVENLGDKSSDFFRVELKRLPLGSGLHEFRGKAPASPLKSGHTVEFTGPKFNIERVICDAGTPCTLDASPQPSLLIALSSFSIKLSDAAHPAESINDGDIRWLRGTQSNPIAIVASSNAPVQLLRILFKTSQK